MKIFHLSDLHIGLKLFNRDLYEDQLFVFRQICRYAMQEQPDAILIAGDIYDKAVPSAEAVEVFDRFTCELAQAAPHAEIMMISGNHDSAPRINVFRRILSRQKMHMIGMPPRLPEEFIEKVTLEDAFGPVNFYLLPFVKPSMVREIIGTDENGNNFTYNEALHRLLQRENIDQSQRNVLVSHQFYLPVGREADSVERMDSEIRTVGNIDQVGSDVLLPFDYAALGHIHKPMKVGSEVYRYCGTPLPCSVSEAGQEKGLIMVELEEKGNVKTSVLPLTPLHAIRLLRGSPEELLPQSCDDYVTVSLTGDASGDGPDLQDRLRAAFPNLLEIRRETLWAADYTMPDPEQTDMDPFSLCRRFLGDLEDGEEALLQEVINSLQEVQE